MTLESRPGIICPPVDTEQMLTVLRAWLHR